MIDGKKILLIPDAYLGDFSGAYVAQIAKRLLNELGYEVAVFTEEIEEDRLETDGSVLFARRKYNSLANWKGKLYRENYEDVLDKFSPSAIFTLGSVTNKNICYWRIARKRGIRVISKIFMQDFFCSNFYANDAKGLCTKCLDKGFTQSLFNNCTRTKSHNFVNTLRCVNSAIVRKKLQKEIVLADAVITSSKQQVDFYIKYGISRENCFITPLYFNGEKLNCYNVTMGNYFVFVAQNRIDKGIHLLKDVLSHCGEKVKVVAAYTSQQKIDEALKKYDLQPYVDNGILEMRPDCTWKTNLGELIAASRGVLNLSIWPTTTEFVLLETLGLKKPIFTFNVGIHPEIIKSGYNGFLAYNSLAMAAQINELANNDVLYETVSKGAYQLYLQMTDWGNWKETLRTILEK